MSHHKVLETERLRLRPLMPTDESRIFDFMNHPEVTEFLLFFDHPLSQPMLHNWLRNVLAASPDYCAYWGIIHKKDFRLIGILSLTFNTYHHKCELGYWMDKDYWKQGLMTEAAQRAIQYAFEELKLHRVELTHMVKNIGSQRVAEKVGFQLEGCYREGHFKRGGYRDVKFYGMLESDYAARNSKKK